MLKNKKGMTLIEIMVVLVILGGLMAMLGSKIFGQKDKANRKQATIQIQIILDKLEEYQMDCQSYPEDLQDLVKEPSNCSNWGPTPYLKKVPKDPWGSDYIYSNEDGTPVLMSYGQDKREGGKGNGKDISSENF